MYSRIKFFGLLNNHYGSISNYQHQLNSIIRLTSTRDAHNSPLFQLRQRTGLAYNLCRQALNKYDDDVDNAEEWLKAQALVHGYQKATKVKDRSAKEGLICLALPEGNRKLTVVKINCETDFVARNKVFRDFAIELTKEIATSGEELSSYQEALEGIKENHSQPEQFADRIVPMISKLGENIQLAQVFNVKIDDKYKNIHLFGKIHAECANETLRGIDIKVGKYAAALALASTEVKDFDRLKPVGNRLCQHIIGYNPEYIELPESLRQKLEDEEKNRLAEAEKNRLEEAEKNKLDEVEHDNRLEEDSGESEESNSRDNWPSLMDHTLIMSEDTSVRDYCKQNQVSLIYFKRFELNQ